MTASADAQLYRDGVQYDLLFPGPSPAVPFLIDQITRYGDPVLELGCGTSTVLLPLARHGFRVTGLDNAPEMMDVGRQKARQAALTVHWVEADMRAFDLNERFGVVILVANALAHLRTRADLEACLACVRKHLDRDGRFVLSTFMPNLRLMLQTPDQRHPFGRFIDPESGQEVVVTYGNRYEADTQMIHATTYYTYPGQPEQVGGSLALRMVYPQELDALLHYNGFHIEQKYGDFDRSPFDSSAKTQLMVCRLSP